uniref:Uncharacterized protein n=1 Tax=Anguilla anguilla TaxID=7936 RepID=A0A0E9SV19_ANGAN
MGLCAVCVSERGWSEAGSLAVFELRGLDASRAERTMLRILYDSEENQSSRIFVWHIL